MTAAAAEPRREYPGRRGLILHAQGELNPNPAVLTDDLVAEARRRVRDGEKIADLAREWSLDCSALGAAVRGTAWKHVDPATCTATDNVAEKFLPARRPRGTDVFPA